MERIVGSLEIKSVQAEQRIVEGWASTGTRDRAGDQLDPFGCQFDLERRPIPFLLDHDASFAVGEIIAAEVSSRGVYFRAQIRKIDQPGKAKDQVDYAFDCLKHGLRKSVSVGFVPLEAEPLTGGGYFYRAWDWIELSAVATPCNVEALVTSVKRAPGSQVGLRTVKLSERDILAAQLNSDSEKRLAARARIGIPPPKVKLTATDVVNAALAADRAARDARKTVRIIRGKS